MELKTLPTTARKGDVRVVNAVASIHKILDELAPNGIIFCNMQISNDGAVFEMSKNGIKATFRVEKGDAK